MSFVEFAMDARTMAAELLTSADSTRWNYTERERDGFRECAENLFQAADLYEFHPELCE